MLYTKIIAAFIDIFEDIYGQVIYIVLHNCEKINFKHSTQRNVFSIIKTDGKKR